MDRNKAHLKQMRDTTITLRVSTQEKQSIRDIAEKTQGGNISRYLVYLHRQNLSIRKGVKL